jgi:hypothetical protein
VQAALTVLGRRPDPERYRLDLTAARLYGARLEGAQLAGARMTDVHLDGALLHQADPQGAALAGASLRHVVLAWTRPQGSSRPLELPLAIAERRRTPPDASGAR